jgi:hypothetical protein
VDPYRGQGGSGVEHGHTSGVADSYSLSDRSAGSDN